MSTEVGNVINYELKGGASEDYRKRKFGSPHVSYDLMRKGEKGGGETTKERRRRENEEEREGEIEFIPSNSNYCQH